MSGHHMADKLMRDIEAAVAGTDTLGPATPDDVIAQSLLGDVRTAFTDYCPNVQLVSDEQVDALAKAFHNKVLSERRRTPGNQDMIVLPWEEEEDAIQDSWRDSIRFILATGELPREGMA